MSFQAGKKKKRTERRKKAGEGGGDSIRAFTCLIPVSLLFAPGPMSPSFLSSCSQDCSFPEPFGQIYVTGASHLSFLVLQKDNQLPRHMFLSGRPKGCSDLGWDWLKLNRRIIIVLWKLSSSAEATSFCTDAGQGNCPHKGSMANCSGLSSWGSRSKKHRNQAAGQSPLPNQVDGASARATKGLRRSNVVYCVV